MMTSKKPNILIIANNPDDLAFLAEILEGVYTIAVAHQGAAALEMASALPPPELILLDEDVGEPDDEICRSLKGHPATSQIPLVFLTARAEAIADVLGLEGSALDVITKPFNPALVRARVGNYLTLGRCLVDSRKLPATPSAFPLDETFRNQVHHGQLSIIRLLETALQPLSLHVQLQEVLEIISSIPFLKTESHGAIFLSKPDGALVLVAQKGADESFSQRCAKIQPGQCLCGRAAQERRIVFTNHLDESHHIRYPGIRDHGHYAVPLMEKERLLGVLVFCLTSQHQPRPGEYQLMEEVGKVVSELISRRLMEAIIQVKKFELQDTQEDIIRKLGVASEYRDTETGLHVIRVGHYAARIGAAFGLSQEEQELLMLAAPMHDVGKIGIPDSILLKQGRLMEDEFKVMKNHTLIGSRILSGTSPIISAARIIAMTHHEKWDGTGYPHGLAGEDIPLFGRLCAIADVFDALTMERPYKPAWSEEMAIDLIKEHAGTHFDPRLVDAFFLCYDDILLIKNAYRDDTPGNDVFTSLRPLNPEVGDNPLWKDDYLLNVEIIDGHHRYLFRLVHQLEQVLADRQDIQEICSTLKALENYAIIHFSAEERLMFAHDDPDYANHKAAHLSFEKKVQEFWELMRTNPLLAQLDIVSFLQHWLTNHIVAVDSKLRYLQKGEFNSPRPPLGKRRLEDII
ncbi:putative two-component system response regulator [Gammaproteobacteria bacterium]